MVLRSVKAATADGASAKKNQEIGTDSRRYNGANAIGGAHPIFRADALLSRRRPLCTGTRNWLSEEVSRTIDGCRAPALRAVSEGL